MTKKNSMTKDEKIIRIALKLKNGDLEKLIKFASDLKARAK